MNIFKITILSIALAIPLSAMGKDCSVFIGGLGSVIEEEEMDPLYVAQIRSMESFFSDYGYSTVPTRQEASIELGEPYAVCVRQRSRYCRSSHVILTIYDKLSMPYTYTFGGRFSYISAKKALSKSDKALKNFIRRKIGRCENNH